MYIAPGQGLTTPWGRNFNVNWNLLSLRSFVVFFMILYVYIAPGQGLTAPRGQSFDVNRNVSLHSFVASFKTVSLKSDFIQFLYDFIHVYSPGAGADRPQGRKFHVNRKTLSLYPFVASFKHLFEVLFYTIFS